MEFRHMREIRPWPEAAQTHLPASVPVHFEVLEVGTAGARTIAAVQALDGKPRAGMRLVVERTGQPWLVRGLAFAPIEAVEADRWGLVLAPEGDDETLQIGDSLHQLIAPATVAK